MLRRGAVKRFTLGPLTLRDLHLTNKHRAGIFYGVRHGHDDEGSGELRQGFDESSVN